MNNPNQVSFFEPKMEVDTQVVEQVDEVMVESDHCSKCFKRRVIGASDVSNAYSKLRKGKHMQKCFLEKHEDAEKAPRTLETRKRLLAWFEKAEEDFKSEFASQMAPACDDDHELVSRKRKRSKKE